MSFDLRNYGKPVGLDTKDFTKDIQERIVDGYFKGTPGGVYNELVTRQNDSQDTNDQYNNRQQGGREEGVKLTREQYEQLLRRGANDATQTTAQPQQMNERQQQPYQQEYQQTPPVNNTQEQTKQNDATQTNGFEDLLNEALGLSDSKSNNVSNSNDGQAQPGQQQQMQTQQQQAQYQTQQGQQQQQSPPSYEELAYAQQLQQYSQEAGVSPQEVIEFSKNIGIKDIVEFYKASKNGGQSEQSNRPINLSEANGYKKNVPTNPISLMNRQKSIY
jgi:hypothetical protein